MQSQYLKGLKKTKTGIIFPCSPTLIKNLPIDEKIKEDYFTKRENLIRKKEKTPTIYDKRLRPYQNQDVNYLIQFKKGKGVFNQQRTGKTPTSLVTMRELNQNKNILIVPASTLYGWKKEYKKWHGGDTILIKDRWNKEKRIKQYKKNKGKTLITSKDIARLDLDAIIKHLGPFDAALIDEAHSLRNYTNAIISKDHPVTNNKAAIKLRKNAKDAYALTGTPTPNRVDNICGILAFLFPDLFISRYQVWDYYFIVDTNQTWRNNRQQEYSSVRGFQSKEKQQELLEFIEIFSIQRKRKDVMKWIPKVDYETILLDTPPKIINYSNQLKEYMETTDGKIICENRLTAMIRERQLTTCPKVLDIPNMNTKFDWIEQRIKEHPDTPIIIASMFTTALKLLEIRLKKYNPKSLIGDTPNTKREIIRTNFQTGKFNILIGNIDVIKEGITLSRAEELIVIDPSLTYTDNEQLEDRFLPVSKEEAIKKEGQRVIRLIQKGTIDSYILDSLHKKKKKTDIINNYINSLR